MPAEPLGLPEQEEQGQQTLFLEAVQPLDLIFSIMRIAITEAPRNYF